MNYVDLAILILLITISLILVGDYLLMTEIKWLDDRCREIAESIELTDDSIKNAEENMERIERDLDEKEKSNGQS